MHPAWVMARYIRRFEALIESAELPADLWAEIVDAYDRLVREDMGRSNVEFMVPFCRRVAFEFDERDPGVRELLHQAVAAFLARLGIDALSLNPDSVVKTTLAVLGLEKTAG